MKQCSMCKEVKVRAEFNKRAASNDGVEAACRECKKQQGRAYYASHQDRKTQVRATRQRHIRRNQEYVLALKQAGSCTDCGESDPVVLDFDHVTGVKEGAISKMVRNAASLTSLAAEIAKCELRCANCHRRVTAARGFGRDGNALA
jgi:hypothetical protein